MKKIFLFAILLAIPCTSRATWSLTQVKSNNSCNGTTCAVTVTSTGSGHLLVAGVGVASGGSAVSISSVTAAACSSTWTHAPSTNLSVSGDGAVDLYYCLSSASGQTSISITNSASFASWIAVIWEASSTLGNISIDAGSTPSGTVNDTTSCTSCNGTSLTLSGNNDFIAAVAAGGNNATGLTGTGWTNDLSNPGGYGVGHGITNGTQTAPATWVQSPTGSLIGNAAAFQEAQGCGPT